MNNFFDPTPATQYFVNGGIYSDFTFTELDEWEMHGPFPTYQEAYDEWKASVWKNVDNALHRLKIEEMTTLEKIY